VIPAALSSSQLTTRIMRLVHYTHRPAARGSLAWTCGGTALVLATVGVATSVPLIGELAPQLAAVISTSQARPAQARPASRSEPIAAPPAERAMMAAITPNPSATSRGRTRTPAFRAPEVFTALRQAAVRTPVSIGDSGPSSGEHALPEASSLPVVPGDRISITAPSPRFVPEGGSPSTTPWSAAADAGIAIGRGSTKAARATAGFFTRMSKSIAGGN